jgi:hypothetical protein
VDSISWHLKPYVEIELVGYVNLWFDFEALLGRGHRQGVVIHMAP